MSRSTARQAVFTPLQDKELESVLLSLFVDEFGYDNKVIFAKAMIRRILETLDAFMQPRSLVKPGQLVWMAVANDGRKHARKRMREIPQVPVVLDLITKEDLHRLADGESHVDVRRQRNARLLEQAFAQGGVLAQSDVAAITLVSRALVGLDIKHFQNTEHCLLPYRGTIQDIGPTITHKVEAIRLFEAGYLEPDICTRLSPGHSLEAVERYTQTYKNVLKLLRRQFSPLQIAQVLSVSKKLAAVYAEIACDHHPDIADGNPYLPLTED